MANLWREYGLKPHRSGTFKLSRDPAFAAKVADIVGLYLDPPGGAVILSLDEKTQIQALDRTQRLLPIEFDATEKRTHDYVRHGTTNLFAALNIATGEVIGECRPSRNGAQFLAFLRKAVAPHRGRDVHVVLDNLSTHTPPTRWPGSTRTPTCTSTSHPDRLQLDQPDRDLVRHHHPPGHPPRHLLLRPGPDPVHPRLHHHLERQPPPVHVDRDSRRDPGQSPTRTDQHQTTRRQQRQVNPSASRDTRTLLPRRV
ncbi:IS630 family transposase [Micromonospora sp. WMMD1102]|nr:IS630 family transposase [Micromonospora sp. WMMD1102]MDG4790658.1 IS630 family transposase [Micromonospora sp. WMMD1102]